LKESLGQFESDGFKLLFVEKIHRVIDL